MNDLYGNAAISAGIKAGNINISGAMKVEVMELSAESKESQQEHAKLLRQFEATKRARTIVVPTNVDEIKRQLRGLNQPVTLFGETPMDRRDRLREVLAALELNDEELNKIQVFCKVLSLLLSIIVLLYRVCCRIRPVGQWTLSRPRARVRKRACFIPLRAPN